MYFPWLHTEHKDTAIYDMTLKSSRTLKVLNLSGPESNNIFRQTAQFHLFFKGNACLCVYMYVCTCESRCPQRPERVLNPLELKLQVVIKGHEWALGTEIRSS